MNQQELRAKIDTSIALVANELPTATAKVAGFVIAGLTLFGELLIDIKRIADNSEQHHHYTIPDGYELVQEGAIVVVRPITQGTKV